MPVKWRRWKLPPAIGEAGVGGAKKSPADRARLVGCCYGELCSMRLVTAYSSVDKETS